MLWVILMSTAHKTVAYFIGKLCLKFPACVATYEILFKITVIRTGRENGK